MPNSQIQGRRAGGPGEGPAYGRAKLQAERDRIRQAQMNGSMSFTDPMEHLRGGEGRKNSYNKAANGEYSPSFNEGSSGKRGEI